MEKYGAKRLVCPGCGKNRAFEVRTSGERTVRVDGDCELDGVSTVSMDIANTDRCECLDCGFTDGFINFEKAVGEDDAR